MYIILSYLKSLEALGSREVRFRNTVSDSEVYIFFTLLGRNTVSASIFGRPKTHIFDYATSSSSNGSYIQSWFFELNVIWAFLNIFLVFFFRNWQMQKILMFALTVFLLM